jgi:hypothetical protein
MGAAAKLGAKRKTASRRLCENTETSQADRTAFSTKPLLGAEDFFSGLIFPPDGKLF